MVASGLLWLYGETMLVHLYEMSFLCEFADTFATVWVYANVYPCVCVCVCEKERERAESVCMCKCVLNRMLKGIFEKKIFALQFL